MTSIIQQTQETPEQWLARLKGIEAITLPVHTQRALILSIGYARHLVRKANGNAPVSVDLVCYRALA